MGPKRMNLVSKRTLRVIFSMIRRMKSELVSSKRNRAVWASVTGRVLAGGHHDTGFFLSTRACPSACQLGRDDSTAL